MKDLDKRLDKEIQISEDMYSEGLLDITAFLYGELCRFLEEEGRFIGITKSYTHSMQESYSRMNKTVTEEDIDTYGRLLYLYKPLLRKEFKRLRSKKLSSGDSVIVIMNKILDIIFEEKTPRFRYTKEFRTVKKIVTKFYDNIRNPKKKDPLFILSNTIKTYMESGKVGKFPLHQFSLSDVVVQKVELSIPGERVDEEGGKKVSEINL